MYLPGCITKQVFQYFFLFSCQGSSGVYMRYLRWPYNIILVSLLLVPVLVLLGLWQMDRGQTKEELALRLEQRLRQPPVSGEQLAGEVAPLLWRWVELDGEISWGEEVLLLDNSVYHGRHGVDVFQPAVYRGSFFLVNRGWLAWNRQDAEPRVQLAVPGGISGQLRPWPQAGLQLARSPQLTGMVNLITALDKAAIEAWLGQDLLAGVIYLVAGQPNAFTTGRPVGSGTGAMRHYGYMVQWFGLALALLGLSLWVWLRHSGRHRD